MYGLKFICGYYDILSYDVYVINLFLVSEICLHHQGTGKHHTLICEGFQWTLSTVYIQPVCTRMVCSKAYV